MKGRGELLNAVAARAAAYLEAAQTRRVSPEAGAEQRLAERCGSALPEEPLEGEALVEFLDEWAGPATSINAGGRYFGFVNGGTLPGSLAASWMVSTWDQNAGMRVSSPAAAVLEDEALRWVAEIFGLPEGCGGSVVTGATMANFTCLCAARHALLERAGWDVEAKGMFGAPEVEVVVGEEFHVSLRKALGLAGFGRDRVRKVPVDGQGRMVASEIGPLTERTLIAIQAGNVNSGAFDPAEEICAQAREAGAWIHVDGAFGLWAAASPHYRHLTAGFADADSWAADGHKWPNAGYDCGVALVRDPAALRGAMSLTAAYLVGATESREPLHYNPEMSRRARGVELWATLRSLGKRGLAELVERTCRHAQRFAEGFREAGYEVLNEVVINQVMVSFGSAERTIEVTRRIQFEGTCWAGTTVWQGRTAMRISVSNWVTSEADVEASLAAMLRCAAGA